MGKRTVEKLGILDNEKRKKIWSEGEDLCLTF